MCPIFKICSIALSGKKKKWQSNVLIGMFPFFCVFGQLDKGLC